MRSKVPPPLSRLTADVIKLNNFFLLFNSNMHAFYWILLLLKIISTPIGTPFTEIYFYWKLFLLQLAHLSYWNLFLLKIGILSYLNLFLLKFISTENWHTFLLKFISTEKYFHSNWHTFLLKFISTIFTKKYNSKKLGK